VGATVAGFFSFFCAASPEPPASRRVIAPSNATMNFRDAIE
jgi:hypothetical protein